MDLSVILGNWKFLIIQGFIGFGPFIGGTLRLAIPAIVLGFVLGIFVGLARLAQARWLRVPATAYVEFFRWSW
jgi:ABC-type amino acid transport system permease subunit